MFIGHIAKAAKDTMEAIIQIILSRLNVKPIITTGIMGLGISS